MPAREIKRQAEANYATILKLIGQDLKLTGVAQSVLQNYGKKHFGKNFLGVFPRDLAPKLQDVQVGQCCIVNNQTSMMGGEHWLALGKAQDGKWIQYDSFGRKDFLKLGRGNSRDTERDAEQKDEEINCGNRSLAWCAVFLWHGEDQARYI